MRVLIVEDETYMAEAIRDGLRLDAIAADIAGDAIGADDYLTKPLELRELVLLLRSLDRRRAHSRPPVRQIAGLRLDPVRREVYRDGRYVALTRKQFAVPEVLMAAEGGVAGAGYRIDTEHEGGHGG